MLSFLEDEDPSKLRRSLFLAATISIVLSRFDDNPDLVRLFIDVEGEDPLISNELALFWIWVAISYLLLRYALHLRSAYLAYKSDFDGVLKDHAQIVEEYNKNQHEILRHLKRVEIKCDEIDRHCRVMFDPHILAQGAVGRLIELGPPMTPVLVEQEQFKADILELQKKFGKFSKKEYDELEEKRAAMKAKLYTEHEQLDSLSETFVLQQIDLASSSGVKSAKTAALDGLFIAPFALLCYIIFAFTSALPILV